MAFDSSIQHPVKPNDAHAGVFAQIAENTSWNVASMINRNEPPPAQRIESNNQMRSGQLDFSKYDDPVQNAANSSLAYAAQDRNIMSRSFAAGDDAIARYT